MVLIQLFCFSLFIKAQVYKMPFDTLDAAAVKLSIINLKYGNTYVFELLIEKDSVVYVMPNTLPKGYYEAYYEKDTNRLALTYYNFGRRSYVQQFYRDGSIKSDSEYDAFGNMHGLHVVYDQEGNELWHVDYYHRNPEEKYTLDYLDRYNYTKEILLNGKAWGCYEFSPTPMRERHDQISLNKDGTFDYHNFMADCDCRRHSKGIWTVNEDNLLKLTVNNKEVWNRETKYYAIISTHKHKRIQLIEVLSSGLHWYASEYWFCKRCNCIGVEE